MTFALRGIRALVAPTKCVRGTLLAMTLGALFVAPLPSRADDCQFWKDFAKAAGWKPLLITKCRTYPKGWADDWWRKLVHDAGVTKGTALCAVGRVQNTYTFKQAEAQPPGLMIRAIQECERAARE